MDQNNITSLENDDKPYTIIDLYLNNRFLGNKDSYNYYDIDVDKILLLKKSDNEYIIRYNNVNKMMIVPLQLKINNSYNEINAFKKIWDKIIELIGINNPIYFLKADEDDELFIMADVHKNTSFVIEDNYRYGHNKVVIVLHCVINHCIKTLFVQHRY